MNLTFDCSVKNPVELKRNDWEVYTNGQGDIDHNNSSCNWQRVHNWEVIGSDYRIPDLRQLQ